MKKKIQKGVQLKEKMIFFRKSRNSKLCKKEKKGKPTSMSTSTSAEIAIAITSEIAYIHSHTHTICSRSFWQKKIKIKQ